jgi:hypothetical protein
VPALRPVAAGPTTTVMWAPRVAQTVCE